MILSPLSKYIGGAIVNSGIYRNNTEEAIGGGTATAIQPQPDLSDIDLTIAALDSRITYSGPAHLFWNEVGVLATSNLNEWPLEFRNGLAVGRSLPEPESTNLQVNCRAIVASDNVKPSTGFTIDVDVTGAPDGGSIGILPIVSEFYLISQDVSGVDLVSGTAYSISTDWTRLVFPVTTTADSRTRIWLGRDLNSSDGTPFVFLTQTDPLTSGNYVFSWFAKETSDDQNEFVAGIGMIENGNYPYSTSPIITEDANQVTRTESSVNVALVGDSQSIAVVYDDGTIDIIPFNNAQSISLPFASFDWSEKYVTRIKYLDNVPDLSPIDLTTQTLDPRVTYTGPEHSYLDSEGLISTTSPNEWPLEYFNGLVAGRHEPEPETKNYALDSDAFDRSGPGSNANWMFSQGTTVTIEGFDPRQFAVIDVEPQKVFINVYNENDATFFFNPDVNPGTDSNWDRDILRFTNSTESELRFYTQRENSQSYLYQHCPGVPAGNCVASVVRRLTDTNMQSTAPQIEIGTLATSPIYNGPTEQNTRPASSVTVSNPGGATGIVLHFTDGTTSEVAFINNVATLPMASQDYSTRYITQITFTS